MRGSVIFRALGQWPGEVSRRPSRWSAPGCPTFGLFVFGNIFINPGLVGIGLVAPLSLADGLLYLPLIAIQIATIWLFVNSHGKLLSAPTAAMLDPLARSRCADAHGPNGDACRNRSAGRRSGPAEKRGAIPVFAVGRARRRRQPPCHSRG